jgi:hypothetical protein
MNNMGPIDSFKNTKTGKELINELFQASGTSQINNDEEEDDFDDSDNEQEMKNKSQPTSSNSSVKENDQHEISTCDKDELLLSRKRSLQQESNQIILNLSKQTLRNILMLVCNEAVYAFIVELFLS